MDTKRSILVILCSVLMAFQSIAYGQSVTGEQQASSSTSNAATVPGLVRFSGTLKDQDDKPLTGTVGVTFSLYKTQDGGSALWMETQNVKLDDQGNYSVLLGSTSPKGMPQDLFNCAEPRWLGVQVQGQDEQARALLVSVPYALKAGDAQTLGGRPYIPG